ncbi:MAG TPA: hypothetical protein VFW83_02775, partial [Bryobacteraceae bacterium]|nr:hypothetical protein [Bryobacteraceae bacterium]
IKQESQSWTLYYAKLSGAAKGVTSGVTPPVTGAAPTSVTAPRVSVRAPVGPPSITPLPLIRYTGGWVFPPLGGMFHGPQPDSIDLEVSQSNNHVTGTFYGKFKLPRESKQDPVVRFDFSGDFQPNRNQAFRIRAPDGSTGTVELIPGNAFNLLEVNFQMGAQPGQPEKIRAADVLLVKK